MSRKGLTDKHLEECLYQSSDSENEDNIETEENFTSDSDDSVVDPDFAPSESDIEEAFQNNLKKTWIEPRTPHTIEEPHCSALSQDGLRAPSTSNTTWMVLFLICTSKIGADHTAHHRQKRYLVYPFQGTFKTVYSFAIPWKLGPKQEMGVGWNIQFQYPLPYNTTSVSTYPDIISRTSRDKRELEEPVVSDRAVFFNGVENLLDGLGINGKDCLLKTICENADYTHFDDDGGLLGQILHIFLSPNDKDGTDPALAIEYADAQKAGEYGADCSTLYTNCNTERSFFNWFSINGK